ncbi:EGFR adapter protein isoform X2 [Drosophila biarmipes]|uniref:EGFR adapter protein isoform X2 n=1 Tax=Drosophila biarmipes TaxID=125945 RepID=UPI0007E779AD|nr:EGFR adapter protein isoform X2 [Drosophila biarmipes]
MTMQDIRLRLEPQHSTATFISSSSASSSSSQTAETTLIEAAEDSPASEAAVGAVTKTSPQHYFHYHHPPTHPHPHPHPQPQPRQQQHPHSHSHPHPHLQRRPVEQLHLLHSHHDVQELPGQEHPHPHSSSHPHPHPHHLRSPSSEEDNSPTEMNNCRRLVDKPPLVKRLTMGIGLLRGTEDSRPLVHSTCGSSLTSGSGCGSTQTISDGYVNEAICEPDKYVASKFGDSCRQSLSALESATQRLQVELPASNKKYLRETCSANSSPKLFSAHGSLRLDNLSLSEQQELKGAAWFQAGIPREISLEVLSRQSPGAFLVRQSSTKPGCFALSLRVPPPSPRVAHYLILRTQRGYKIKGFTKEFSSLKALITHHSVMPELLPVPLTLPRPPNTRSQRSQAAYGGGSGSGSGGADFEMYGSLNDFRKMMADLNV